MLASQEEILKATEATASAAQFCSTALVADVDTTGSSDTSARRQHVAMENKLEGADCIATEKDAKSSDNEREAEVKERLRRQSEQKANGTTDGSQNNATNDISSDEEKLHNFMLKGVSLGYDHKTVLSALRHVSSETTISGFVEALIRCEEQNNDVDNRYSYRREQKSLEPPGDDTQAILDGVDVEAAYSKEQNGMTGRGVQIAFRALQSLNFSRCIVVFTTWPLFVESKQGRGFVQELVKSNSLILLAEEPPEVGTKILKQVLKVKSVIFSQGCSEKSLLHILRTNRHILPLGRHISIACYHFDFDRFVVEGWNFPLKAKNVDRDLCPIGAVGIDTGKNLFHPAELCPYGNKCTYGNKCKYYHPERGTLEQISLTEQLIRKALVEREKLEESFRERGSLSAIVSEKRKDDFKRTVCDQDGTKEEQNIGRFAIEKCSNGDRQPALPDDGAGHKNTSRLTAKIPARHTSIQEETHECHQVKSKQGHYGLPPSCCSQYLANGKARERKDVKFANSVFPAPQQGMCMNYPSLPLTLSGSQDGLERFVLTEAAKAAPSSQSCKNDKSEIQAAGSEANNYESNYFTWSANGRYPPHISESVWPVEAENMYYRMASIHQTNSADTLHSLGKSSGMLPTSQRNNRPRMSPNGAYHPPMLGSQDPDTIKGCIYADGINFADAGPFNTSEGTDGLCVHRGSLNSVSGHNGGLERACWKYSAKPKRVPFYVDEQVVPCRAIYTVTSDLGSSTFSNSSRSLSLSSSLSSSLNAVGGSFSDLSIRDSKPSFFKPKSDWYLCRDNLEKPKLSSRSSTDLAITTNGSCAKAEVNSPALNPYQGIAESFEHFEHPDLRFHKNGPVKPFAPGFSTVYEHDLGQLRQP